MAILDLEPKLSEADREKILGPLLRAEARAERRAPSAEEDKGEDAKGEPGASAPENESA